MKIKQINQIGSAHAIIIVLLVVALMGVLGIVFYQNFIANKTNSTPTLQETTSTNESSLKTVRIAFDSKIYAFDYPEGWLATTESPADGTQRLVLQNPDKTIRVAVSISGGGFGGFCDTNGPYKVRYYQVGTNAVTKLNDSSAYVVAAMVDADGGGYNYRIGLTEEGGGTHAAVGDSFCTTTHVGVASQLVLNGSAITHPLITEMIDFPKLAVGTDTRVREMQQVKDIMATDDYKSAVKILESSRRE